MPNKNAPATVCITSLRSIGRLCQNCILQWRKSCCHSWCASN